MSRPLLIVILLVVLAIAVLIGLAAMDREVPQTRVERPVADAPKL